MFFITYRADEEEFFGLEEDGFHYLLHTPDAWDVPVAKKMTFTSSQRNAMINDFDDYFVDVFWK